jgi:ring-1,2-phenylacetyl-CoA epoxidase subunit PaaE
MIRAILKHEPESIITLFYSNRLYSTILFREELTALASDHPDKLRIHHILTREEDVPPQFPVAHKGRLSRLVIRKMVKEVTRDTTFATEYFLCGPYDFMSVASEALRSLDVRNIHREHFFVPDSEDDVAFATFPSKKVSIRLKDRDETIVVESGKSILQAALENNLNVTYSCTEGQCGLCRATLLSGDVRLRRNHVLTSEELREGQILLCQGYPVSENVLLTPIN